MHRKKAVKNNDKKFKNTGELTFLNLFQLQFGHKLFYNYT